MEEEKKGEGWELAWRSRWSMVVVKTCMRKGRANRVDETPMEVGGVTLWWDELVCNRPRPGVEPEEGCRDRIGIRFGARLAILPLSGVREVLAARTRRPELSLRAVGRWPVPKRRLHFKLASGFRPASRCLPSTNQTPQDAR
jgi:hypothetical protein